MNKTTELILKIKTSFSISGHKKLNDDWKLFFNIS